MFLSRLIVQKRSPIHTLCQHLIADNDTRLLIQLSIEHRHLQRIERCPGVSIRKPCNRLKLFFADLNRQISKAFRTRQCRL